MAEMLPFLLFTVIRRTRSTEVSNQYSLTTLYKNSTSITTRNLAVYKRPIGATVYFDGWTEKLQERGIFSPSEKKSWERVHYYPFAWLPSKYTSVAPIGLLYTARFLVIAKPVASLVG